MRVRPGAAHLHLLILVERSLDRLPLQVLLFQYGLEGWLELLDEQRSPDLRTQLEGQLVKVLHRILEIRERLDLGHRARDKG